MAALKTLATMPDGLRNSAVRAVKLYVYRAGLARILELQDAYEGFGAFRFDPAEVLAGGKRWDGFLGSLEDPKKRKAAGVAVVAPFSVSTEAATALLAPLLDICNVAIQLGSLPASGTVGALVASKKPGCGVVAALAAIGAHMGPMLRGCHLGRDFGSEEVFSEKIGALIPAKAYSLRGGVELARLYVAFLRAVAWFAGGGAWSATKFTLNLGQLWVILSSMQLCTPDSPLVADMLTSAKEQIDAMAEAKTRAAAAKAASKAARGAKPAAKTAAAASSTRPAPAKPTPPAPVTGAAPPAAAAAQKRVSPSAPENAAQAVDAQEPDAQEEDARGPDAPEEEDAPEEDAPEEDAPEEEDAQEEDAQEEDAQEPDAQEEDAQEEDAQEEDAQEVPDRGPPADRRPAPLAASAAPANHSPAPLAASAAPANHSSAASGHASRAALTGAAPPPARSAPAARAPQAAPAARHHAPAGSARPSTQIAGTFNLDEL